MASDLEHWLAEQPPIHPGEILDTEFLRPLNISQYRIAKSIGVDVGRVHAIVHGQRAVTAETALLLAQFFGNRRRVLDGIAESIRSGGRPPKPSRKARPGRPWNRLLGPVVILNLPVRQCLKLAHFRCSTPLL